jgi:hypothetical protein
MLNSVLYSSTLRRMAASLSGCMAVLCLASILCGCASAPHPTAAVPARRAFDFPHDTFAYSNELVWDYHYDEHGKWVSHPHHPKPDYTHHCFVVARSARQFFEHARFDPAQPPANDATYRRLIKHVISLGANHEVPDSDRIVIPGYANLRDFSSAHADILKATCGGAWQSYLQRGHWRMIFFFTRHHQEKMAQQLLAHIRQNRPPVVHVVRFPQLTINHAIVLFDAAETPDHITFSAYDPNNPSHPVPLTFDRATRTFQYPANDYFPGGKVNIYEVYRDWIY